MSCWHQKSSERALKWSRDACVLVLEGVVGIGEKAAPGEAVGACRSEVEQPWGSRGPRLSVGNMWCLSEALSLSAILVTPAVCEEGTEAGGIGTPSP